MKRIRSLAAFVVGAIILFMFVHLLPGDPARLAAGPDATPATVDLVRKDLGLDKSLPEQFVRFVTGALQGDFGRSVRTKRPVSTEIRERFFATFWLTVAAMALAILGASLLKTPRRAKQFRDRATISSSHHAERVRPCGFVCSRLSRIFLWLRCVT
jgi:ABC-type dipeptide/oligopeptide/nickel transport system permease component